AQLAFFANYLLRGGFLRRTFDEQLYSSSDGFSARFYVREHFEDLFRAFFDNVSATVLAQEADAVPLPRSLRRLVLPLVPERYLQRAQSRLGGFIFLTA